MRMKLVAGVWAIGVLCGSAYAEKVPCKDKIVLADVTNQSFGSFYAATMVLKNTTHKTIRAQVRFGTFPKEYKLKMPGLHVISIAAGGTYSNVFAAAGRELNKGDLTLVYDSTEIPVREIKALISSCEQ